MEWYSVVIIILASAVIGGLVFIVQMTSVIDSLRIENSKLQLELTHIERKDK